MAIRRYSHPLDLSLQLSAEPESATVPPEWRGLRRDEVKLLVSDRTTGVTSHSEFHRIADYLQAGALVVVNTSGTVAASLSARTPQKHLRIHVAGQLSDGTWLVERRSQTGAADSAAFAPNERIEVLDRAGEGVGMLEIVRHFHPRSRLWVAESSHNLHALSKAHGEPIRYGYIAGRPALSLYQTIFARDFNSAEMPSAARPFTTRVLRSLGTKGVKVASLTLHTGVSSHEVDGSLTDHPVIPEWYRIPESTSRDVERTLARGGRVIAVGTTVVRALEGCFAEHGRVVPGCGWTSHLVTPSTPPRVATGLITGFHATQTSHLALLYAFLPPQEVRRAYDDAVKRGYLWHEFGDSHLIL